MSLLSQEQQLLIEQQLQNITSHTTDASVLHGIFIMLNIGAMLLNILVLLCTFRSKTIRASNSGIITGTISILDVLRALNTIVTSALFLSTGWIGGGAFIRYIFSGILWHHTLLHGHSSHGPLFGYCSLISNAKVLNCRDCIKRIFKVVSS